MPWERPFTVEAFVKITKISVVLPALNEADSVASTIKSVPVEELRRRGYETEVIVVDNASEDNTSQEAIKAGARVVYEPRRGYGRAYLTGFSEASGDIIVIGDADGTYDLTEIPKFIEEIAEGRADFVMGSRFKGRMEPGSMPWMHRYIGNPLLTGTLNYLFRTRISDTNCGMRAFSRGALEKMNLSTTGMEFASEMLIEAAREGLCISEIPISYHPRTGGHAKLRSFKDGWRHMRFLALYEPTPFLFVPGAVLFLLGLSIVGSLLNDPTSRLHSFLFGGFMTVIGFQIVSMGLYMKAYAITHRLSEKKGFIGKLLEYHSLEMELLFGSALFLIGAMIGLRVIWEWTYAGFGNLSDVGSAMVSLVLASLGLQIIFLALFLSVFLLNGNETKR